ncbi:hypothetical protein [Nocardia anaemiae]|uniref:hypothetical protein n=1 Tax=Nocardia anaemiae TaxID=263910 RepID=UPI0012F4C2F7|nr:hypothetical protein [Nocardia anaemiae]
MHDQTVRRHFPDHFWGAVCAALCERYRTTPGMNAPANVRTWAQEYYDRQAGARLVAAPTGTDELRDRFAAASTADDDTELAVSAKALVDKLSGTPANLTAHAGEIIECAKNVRARVGASSSIEATEATLSLNDAAVQAHRHLAAGPGGSGNTASEQTRLILQAGDGGSEGAVERTRRMLDQALYEPQHMQAIIQIKRWDKEISERLGLKVRAVLSQFHIDRAEAMIGRQPEGEIASLQKVVTDLRALQKDDEHPACPTSADVVMLVARLAGVSLAYPELLKNDELTDTRAELLRLFQMDGHKAKQLKRDALSLFKMVDDKPVEAIELLRALRFRGPGDYLIARYLANQAEMSDEQIQHRFGQTLGPPDHVRILLLNRSCSCYDRVRVTSRVSGCAATLAGMAEAEMLIAQNQIAILSHGAPPPEVPTGDQTIEHLLRNINDLVHRAVVGKTLDPRQVGRLVNALDPIRTFLMGSAKHRL